MPEQREITIDDVKVGLQLYDLRREKVMRDARRFITFDFWPGSFDEYLAIANDLSTKENAYLRQVLSYWEMAASFVLRGALHPATFLDCCAEGLFVYAKFKPLIPIIREHRDRSFLLNLGSIVDAHAILAREVEGLEGWIKRRAVKVVD